MARIPQPRELAELKGAPKHDPQRYRKEPPKNPYGLGDAPATMDPGAKAAWFELQTHALPGVLTASDRFVVELASNLLAEFRADPMMFSTGKMGNLRGLLAEAGFGPAARQKFGVDKPAKPDNEFNDF